MSAEKPHIPKDLLEVFTSCSILSLHGRNFGDEAPEVLASIVPDPNQDPCFDILETPEKCGIVVARNDMFAASEGATDTYIALAMDLIPKHIQYVICIRPRVYTPERSRQLSELGMSILIDWSDSASSDTVFDTVIPKDASLDKNSTFWKVIPNDLRAYLSFLADDERDCALMEAWTKEFGRSSWGEDFDLAEMIDMLSFGNMTYTPAHRTEESRMAPWLEPLVQERLFAWRDAYTDEFNETLQTFRDIVRIWHVRFRENYLALEPDTMITAAVLARLKKAGEAFGVKKSIDTYYYGVPLNDIA